MDPSKRRIQIVFVIFETNHTHEKENKNLDLSQLAFCTNLYRTLFDRNANLDESCRADNGPIYFCAEW